MVASLSSETSPYLSVVVSARHDNRRGNPIDRLQAFVTCFDAQCHRTSLDAEVIIVEWNPPADRPALVSLIRWPDPCRSTYRFVEVPPQVHARQTHAAIWPEFVDAARNAGIRRARGRYVVATRSDVLFSDELMDFIASGALADGRLYRVDRRDVDVGLPLEAPLDEQMAHCATHQLRVHERSGTRRVSASGATAVYANDIVDGRTVQLGSGWHDLTDAPHPYRWASDRTSVHVDIAATHAGSEEAPFLEIEFGTTPTAAPLDREIEIVDDVDGVIARAPIHKPGVFQLRLPRGARRTLEFRVVTTDGRRIVPQIEGRSRWFAVRSIRVQSRDRAALNDAVSYAPAGWRPAPGGGEVDALETAAGLEVITDARRYAYALEYGPLRVTREGRCEFALQHRIASGGVAFGALKGDRSEWLASATLHVTRPDDAVALLSLDLEPDSTFWLIVSNDHPGGDDTPSCFAVNALRGPASVEVLRSEDRTNWFDLASKAVADTLTGLMPTALSRRAAANAPELDALREKYSRLRATHAVEVERAAKPSSFAGLLALETFLIDNAQAPLHFNACGDFQLMARQHWIDLRGYPEFAIESPHVEALLSAMADGAGIRECALPPSCCVFRLDEDTSAPGSSRQGVLEAMAGDRLVTPDERTVFVLGSYMKWAGRAMAFNGPEWGLGSESLPERLVCSPANRGAPATDVRAHRVFDRFETYEGWEEPGFERSFYGLNLRDWLFTGESKGSHERRHVRVGHPGLGEEYFEWIALLTALTRARGRFCIAELGAGWGRWVASAAVLCRQLKLDYRLIAIEAEASHFEWLQMVLRDNDIDPDRHVLRSGAVAAEAGELLLAGPDTPLTMYGNRTIRAEELPEWQTLDGYVFRTVPGVTIAELLKDDAFVDLMDVDVQGVEYDILAPSFDELDAKVRIVHIGTHSRAVEDQLWAAFRTRGWLNAFAYSCKSRAHTIFGEVDFGDGVQTWVNPRWPELLPALLASRPDDASV